MSLEKVERKLQILSQIAEKLNTQKITWAIGASLLLYLKGIVTEFHDIDIMVAEEDVEAAQRVLLSQGNQLPPNPKPQYKTKYFLEFHIAGVDVDMIAGFTIVHQGTDFYFPLKKEDIKDYAEINGVKIPLQSIEEWRIYYELMGRTDKVEMLDCQILI